jgi:hypothetical protein
VPIPALNLPGWPERVHGTPQHRLEVEEGKVRHDVGSVSGGPDNFFLDRCDGPTGWEDKDQVLGLLQMLYELWTRPRFSRSFAGARRQRCRAPSAFGPPPATASVPSFRATLLIS